MMFLFGEVVLIRMNFHQSAGAKVRPAVVLLDTADDDFVAAPITSLLRRSTYDISIEDWRATGLNVASAIRLHKLTVLTKPEVIRTIGQLSEKDRGQLADLMCRAFCPEIGRSRP